MAHQAQAPVKAPTAMTNGHSNSTNHNGTKRKRDDEAAEVEADATRKRGRVADESQAGSESVKKLKISEEKGEDEDGIVVVEDGGVILIDD